MIYSQLSKEYKFDTIAEALYAREVEYFHYEFDATNFEYLLNITTDENIKNDLRNRLDSTRIQMQAVDNIYKALLDQIDDQDAFEAAVLRAIEKRKSKS